MMLKWKVTVSSLGEIYAFFEASEVKHIFNGQGGSLLAVLPSGRKIRISKDLIKQVCLEGGQNRD